MKAVVVLMSIILFFACLVLGIQAGNASISPVNPDAAITSQATSNIHSQRTVMLVNIDDFSAENPDLVSVWLVIYRSDLPKLTLYPLYPSTSSRNSIDLVDNFSIQSDGSLSQKFLDHISDFDFNWDGYIVVDQSGTEQFIDWIGGTDIGNGADIISMIQQKPGTSQIAMDVQNQVASAVCNRLSQVPSSIDWTSLWDILISSHVRSTVSIERINEDWQELTSIGGSIDCEIPQD